VHTHAEDVMTMPEAQNFVRMGVTTIVAGNCGSSELNVGEFFRKLEQTHPSLNVATLIGHGSVRAKAMGGSFDRPPTDQELAAMKTMVEQGMKDGAVGLSTGLIYLPGIFAKTDEIVELAKVASRYDGIYASHMRNEARDIFAALHEVFRVAREAGLPAEVSHIKLSGKSAWGRASEVLDAIERARADGLDITQDQYVYTASSTGLGQLIPDQYQDRAEKLSAWVGSERKALIAEMKSALKARGQEDFSYAVITDYPHDPTLNGLNLAQAAQKARGAAGIDDQIELILEIESHGGAGGIFHGISEEDLRTFLRHPNTMFASDSSVRHYQEGVPHPRGYGNNARVLARYVRELKLLSLEDAIRRMTSLPAATFRLKGRGSLREGNWADVVVFDPATVQDRSQFEDPHHYATGFACVLVNGVVVVRNDKQTQARPGQVLRHAVPPSK
jgi:N-acyl-D-amino-acid deacylase